MKEKKILILGDTHGRWIELNKIINKKQPDKIFICGDFGYWPNFDVVDIKKIKNHDTKIYWCDGNHEDHIALKGITDTNNEIAKNIFYQPRGSYITLEDGRNVLFIGGADSIDKNSRTPGWDWFPEETIKAEDIDKILNINKKIDIIISHTCPLEFDILSKIYNTNIYNKIYDPSCQWLNIVLEKLNPSLWYFGHWHQYIKGQYKNTNWTCLDMVPNSYYFEWLI
jgi:Icc-related predicted phosphoesterase